MTKSHLFGILAMVGLSLSAFSQKKDMKISWSEPFEIPKKSYEVGFIGDSKSGYTLISHARKKSINLQKFSPSLKLTNTNSIPTKDFPKGYMIEREEEIGGKNYLFYSTWDKKSAVEKLYAQEINKEKGEFKGSPVELLSSDKKLAGMLVMTGFYQFNTAGKWRFEVSADRSRLLVRYRLKPEKKRDAVNKDIIGMTVYDASLKKQWSKEFEMPYTEKDMDNEDYQVDAKGNVYILAKVYTGEKKDRESHYEVLMYDKESSKPSISSFKFTDKFVRSIAITEDKNGRMLIAGYYSKQKNGGTDGAFLLSYDEASKSMKNVHKGFYEFPDDVIKSFETKRVQKKMEKAADKGKDQEVANLVFRDLLIEDDGSIVLTGEQYLLVVTTTTDSKGHVTYHYTYYYQDIYVLCVAPDGSTRWIKKIPKNQVSGSPSGLGFHHHYDGKNHYYFFVDNAKNMNLKKDEAPATHSGGWGGLLCCVKLDENGKDSKSSIFDFREEKLSVRIRDFESVSSSQIIGRATGKGAGKGKGKGSKLLLIDTGSK